MNKLSQYLVDLVLEQDTPIEDVVVVYSGRFQPFHHGHYDSYQRLVNKFGKDSVYIGTSDKVEPGRSPFSFKDKVEIMTRMFNIPKNRIVKVKNPYAPTEILKKYDAETTAYVSFVSTKDIKRLTGKYFREWDGQPTVGYKEGGYVFALPPGGRGVSGTEVRQGLSVDNEEKRRDFFKQIYPKFDERIYNLITRKINETTVIPKEVIEDWVVNKLPQTLQEISLIGGGGEVDDGPNFLYPSFSTFDKVAKERAEDIGFEVVRQITDEEFEDIEVYPRYPNGPVPAVTPYPAGVIGKLTATNQKDFASMEAYDKWLKHVTRQMGLVGYSLVHHRDDVERELSTRYLKELDKILQKHVGRQVTLDDVDVDFEDLMKENLMIGYEGSEDYKKRKNKLADLRKRLDRFNKANTYKTVETKKTNEGYDKLLYYVNYYKNLSPESFSINESKGRITIQIPELQTEQTESGQPYVVDVEELTKQNNNFRKEDWTGKYLQMTLMSIDVGQSIPLEVHEDEDQFLRIEKGEGIVRMGKDSENLDFQEEVEDDFAIFVPAGYYHELVNTGDEPLKLYSIYAPPEHEVGTVHPSKEDDNHVHEQLTEALNKLKLNIPKDIKTIHNAFKREGKKLYVVGGAVRDAILGKSPKDFDLATDAHPEDVVKIAEKYGFHTTEVGKAFGVVLVNGNEIATLRKDIGKGRRPSSVDYTDIEGDVRRRDLTINALFYDIDRKEIVDLVGGIEDLKKNRVRTVGDAKERFDEDPLRKLRALRFAARLGAKLDKATQEAIGSDPSLDGVSAERIRDEFIKSIQSAKSTKKYLETADDLKILPLVFPNLKYNRKDFVNQNDYILLIAYLFRNYTPIRIEKALADMKYTNDEAAAVRFLLQLIDFDASDIVGLKRLQPNVDLTKDQILQWGRMIGQDFRKFVSFELSVSGKDVMAMGYKGKDIGDKIRDMEKARFLGEAAFPIRPGFRFQANKHFQGIKRGAEYVVKDIVGRIGDLTVKVAKAGTNKVIPVNVRSVEELYKHAIMKESLKEKGITDFKSLFKKLPSQLQKRVYALKDIPQRLDYHPEGNTLKHTIVVVNRALKDDDMDMAIAAMFHDIGKDETAEYNPKTGYFSHHGHEKVSAQLVKEYKDWIKEMGGNPANIYYIVRNHMRFKQLNVMRPGKKKKLQAFRAYDKLKKFGKHDRGGLDDGIVEIIDGRLNESKGFNSSISLNKLISDIEKSHNPLDNRTLLLCGGAYGHLSHPFETDVNLSFGQLKDIINTALDGELKLALEKTDGQNLAVSWIDGEIRAARNKSHLKDYGKNSMTIAQVASKFAGRGDLTDGFNRAMDDLSDAIGSLTDKQREKIFANGKKFMSLEVMYPANTNVIPYGHSLLVFHGTIEYDEKGNAIGEDTKAGRILAGMIKQINKDVQKTFSIRSQPVIELPKQKEVKSLKPKYISAVNKLQKEFKLSNRHTVQDYHKAWWLAYIQKNAPAKLDDEVTKGLTNRWAIEDRSFRLNKKNIPDEKVLAWAQKLDKTDLNNIRKQNFRKFEDIFLGVGADLLSFISSALVVNPEEAVRRMKDRLDRTVKDIRRKGDARQIDILTKELERLEAIGGTDKIVPVEGIVFTGPDGRLMKLTGAFAPLNAILGIMTYSR